MRTSRCFVLLSLLIPFLFSCTSGGDSTQSPTGDEDLSETTDLSDGGDDLEDEQESSQGLLAANPEEVRFGAVVLGDVGKETLTLTNNGTEELTISIVRIDNATTPEFSLQTLLQGDQAVEVPIVLEPGQNLAVELQYAPVDAGSDTGTLQVIGENFKSNLLEISLFADEKGESALDVAPRLEFGYAGNIGEEETRALTLWNLPEDPDTNRTLQITKLEVAEGTRDFHLDLDTCATSPQHPILIAPGHSHTCNVVFSPRDAGELAGAVLVETNASEGKTSDNIDLSGRCAPPETVLVLVVDPRGEPVPGAELRLWKQDSVLATTDSRGRAVLIPEEDGEIFVADGATSIHGVYSHQYKRVLPEDEVSVFVLESLPVETMQPVALEQVSAANLGGAWLQFSADDVQLPDDTDTSLFMAEGHPSAAPYDFPEGKELVQMFHFGPDGTAFATPAQLTLPNTLALAPGERIEFHSFDESTLLWEKSAVLEVNAAGTALETVEGGLTHFSAGGFFQSEDDLPEYTVTGLVQDDLGQFLSNIHVFAFGTRGRMLDDDTNAEGRYTISGVRVACKNSPYLTVVTSRSGTFLDDTLTSVSAEVTGDPSLAVEAPVLVLPNDIARGNVRGVALSPLGTPVKNARVTVHPALGWDLTGQTDSDGAFLISSVFAGDARVTISQDELRLFKEISGTVPEKGEWNLGEIILDEVTETDPPTVLWTMPLDGQKNILHLNELRVAFDEALAPASVQATLKRTLTDRSVTGSVTLENETTVVFTPDADFEDGRAYTFTLDAELADLSGNTLGEDFSLSFQTVPPTCPDAECRTGAYMWETETCGFEPLENGTSCRNDYGSCNGEGECVCNNEFMTEDCSACQSGYIGYPDCRSLCGPDSCHGHGTCNPEDGSCTCNDGYEGDCGQGLLARVEFSVGDDAPFLGKNIVDVDLSLLHPLGTRCRDDNIYFNWEDNTYQCDFPEPSGPVVMTAYQSVPQAGIQSYEEFYITNMQDGLWTVEIIFIEDCENWNDLFFVPFCVKRTDSDFTLTLLDPVLTTPLFEEIPITGTLRGEGNAKSYLLTRENGQWIDWQETFCTWEDTCHGHGTCDPADGSCECDNEFMNSTCGACATGYTGYPDCVEDPCYPDPCNDHGVCTSEGEDIACTCAEGYGGDWCDECDAGYSGYPDCVVAQTVRIEFHHSSAGEVALHWVRPGATYGDGTSCYEDNPSPDWSDSGCGQPVYEDYGVATIRHETSPCDGTYQAVAVYHIPEENCGYEEVGVYHEEDCDVCGCESRVGCEFCPSLQLPGCCKSCTSVTNEWVCHDVPTDVTLYFFLDDAPYPTYTVTEIPALHLEEGGDVGIVTIERSEGIFLEPASAR